MEIEKRGYRCATFEIKNHGSEDMSVVIGILWLTLLDVPRGVVHMGYECTSFCWMARLTSKRHLNIIGDVSLDPNP